MLQLPTQTARHFTKATIAKVTPGAKITNRDADPIIKAAADVRTAYDLYVLLSETIHDVKSKHDPEVFKNAVVYLPPSDFLTVALTIHDRKFITQAAITRWASAHRAHYQEKARQNKKWSLALGQKSEGIVTGNQARLHLKEINEIETLLKKALRKREREIDRTWREIGYSQLRRKTSRALMTYHARLKTLVSMKPRGVHGAHAIIDTLGYFAEYEEAALKAGAQYGSLDIDVQCKLLRAASKTLKAALP